MRKHPQIVIGVLLIALFICIVSQTACSVVK